MGKRESGERGKERGERERGGGGEREGAEREREGVQKEGYREKGETERGQSQRVNMFNDKADNNLYHISRMQSHTSTYIYLFPSLTLIHTYT